MDQTKFTSKSYSPLLKKLGYTVIGTLSGCGSFSKVLVAYSEKHRDRVVVKMILKCQLMSDPRLRKFLRNELEIARVLRHPNVIRFFEAMETSSRIVIVMEAAVGGNLLRVIRRETRLPEWKARFWFKQLCNGVEYCHSMGVAHRDLKLENLLLDAGGNLKLADFGLATSGLLSCVDDDCCKSETFCGSCAYAAPEVLAGHAYIPQLADIWSMGVVLHIMVCVTC